MNSDYLKYFTVAKGKDLLWDAMLDVAFFCILQNIKSMRKV